MGIRDYQKEIIGQTPASGRKKKRKEPTREVQGRAKQWTNRAAKRLG